MVSLPSTGGTYTTILQPGWLPTAIRKGIITNVIVGDYLINGVPINFNNCGTNTNGVFTPFAADGTLRNDLLASSTSPTLMGFNIGLLKDDGWNFDPKLTVDETPVAQSIWSARNDVTKAEGSLGFVARQWFPLLHLLQMDLPTLNAAGTASVVPDIGTAEYSIGAPGYQNLCERWIIALGFDGQNSFSITIPRCSQRNQGKLEANKKNPFETTFDYDLVLDPNTNQPYIISAGGSGWLGEGGAPVFSSTPPVATATSSPTHSATVAFTTPTGADVSSLTYTVTQQVNGTGPFVASTLSGSPVVASGTTTLKVITLTASSTYIFQVTAVGDNNASTVSANSNSITAT